MIMLDVRTTQELGVFNDPLPSWPASLAVTMVTTPGAVRARERSIEVIRPLAIVDPTR